MNFDDKYPDLIDMSKEHFAIFEAIETIDDIKSVEVSTTWMDDHCDCVGAVVNGINVSFWWLTREAAAAFEYANDSAKAKKIVFEVIKEGVEIARDDRGDA